MRKLFLFMMVSLDGYFEGKDHDISWHNADNEEFAQFAENQLDEVDTLLFGRRTYELMESFWPTKEAILNESGTARRMNAIKKIVFSHQPFAVNWENAQSMTNVVHDILWLRDQPGKDMAVFGSSNLCVTLLQHQLLDEIRIMVNPLVLGEGTPLFYGITERYGFNLTSSRVFKSGNVLLTYTARPVV